MKLEHFILGLIIVISFYLSLVLHELTHIITCKALNCKLTKWKVGFLLFDEKTKFKLRGTNFINFLSETKEKALCILLSGPVFSIILSILLFVINYFTQNYWIYIYSFCVGAFNLLIFIFSLIPFKNNDGRRILPLVKYLKDHYQVGNLNKGMIIFLGVFKSLITSVMLFIYMYIITQDILDKSIWLISISYLLISLIYIIYLGIKNVNFLESRLINLEKNKYQRKLVFIGSIIFLISLFATGVSYYFDFLILSEYRYITSLILLILGLLVYFSVINVNKYASSSINNNVEHQIVTTGIYSLIRHPLYLGSSLLYLSFGLALGSICGLISMVLLIPILILRVKNEEKVLINSSKEYSEYMNKVKYRIIPFIY